VKSWVHVDDCALFGWVPEPEAKPPVLPPGGSLVLVCFECDRDLAGPYCPACNPEMKGHERIVAAAILVPVPQQFRDRVWNGERSYPDHLIVSAPPPARHHTLMHPMFDISGDRTPVSDSGFLTSTGRYVDREEGLKIALASGQPMIDHPSRHDRLLFSEDLW